MTAITKGIYIVGARRTPFGKFGGILKNTTTTQLQIAASKAAITSAGITPEQVDAVIIGNVIVDSDSNGIYMPRHASLGLGIPIDRPALGVNRACGSGFQSIVSGAQDIAIGASKIVLTGGAENMSQSPFSIWNMRFGRNLGTHFTLEDSLWHNLHDNHVKMSLAVTAENVAEQFKITRERSDEFSLRSHQNWYKAQNAGVFNDEIAPIKVKVKGKEVDFVIDEPPRPKTTLEELSKLAPVFKKNGTVTAGTSSGISDGASAVIIASEAAVKEHNLKPLVRVVGYSVIGVKPEIMGIGPVPAVRNLLKATGMSLNDIGLLEINEAFAAQTLACSDELGVDPSILNINGGGIAIGHPVGASGSRIAGHLAHVMRQNNVKYSIGTACMGGGMGMAMLFELC